MYDKSVQSNALLFIDFIILDQDYYKNQPDYGDFGESLFFLIYVEIHA